ncbi:acyl-CoA thioesterase [Trujillonella endophytica]|uniref:Acyl-CoA thioesterase II n=1 Tax=Trujillonella endophytica TaxID=673521 RepID=A0A1H8QW21_9ACTN|nr:acyl-CoA thioesterase domain-containing protein [Trujillella endophytica]SEO58064.1 acyl-CoA thioesterase II [Trujillella endophytica]
MSDLPDLLQLTEVGERRYHVFQPAEAAEGRDVVFSGQLLGQMMMASDLHAGGKDIRSVHAVFARAGSYLAPIEVEVESLQAGRTWASDTVTARQNGKLLARATVLLTVVDEDLMRHGPAMPVVPGFDELAPATGQAFPGAEIRPVPGAPMTGDVPVESAWHRFDRSLGSPAANRAVLSWATCGQLIGLAMRPHAVDVRQAHRTLNTGVIGHTLHFLDRFDVDRPLLITQEATKAATGRVYGQGSVFTADGELVAAFHQDAMAKASPAALDPRTAM